MLQEPRTFLHVATELVCEWCGRPFVRPHRKGPIPRFCKASCRQRAFELRKLGQLLEAALGKTA